MNISTKPVLLPQSAGLTIKTAGQREQYKTVADAIPYVDMNQDTIGLMRFYIDNNGVEGEELLPFYNEDSGECEGFAFARDSLSYVLGL